MGITLTGFADEIHPNFEKQLAVASATGVRAIEIRGVNGRGIQTYTPREAEGLQRQLAEKGMHVSSVGSPIGKISIEDDFEPHLEKLKHTCEIAHTMDVDFIRMFSFYIPEGKDPGEYKGKVFEQTGRMVDLAKAQGIVLLHENEKGIYGDVASRCL